ncbi:GapR family DNA-binding domain-containing protein [Elstera litoralis]|uniref:GapR family DNA-binding domain-containing protein n=1 Tax=Elstera litoralis TaxID=552518 RepID=UPI0018DC0CA5|nr:GapR family DNA-binding domain-containing protein [Elstera litoralis]
MSDAPDNPDAKAQLRGFADRFHLLLDERQRITEDIKTLSDEVETAGFDKKALRKAVDTERKNRRAALEGDENYQLYKGALGITLETEGDDA